VKHPSFPLFLSGNSLSKGEEDDVTGSKIILTASSTSGAKLYARKTSKWMVIVHISPDNIIMLNSHPTFFNIHNLAKETLRRLGNA
jgi:hypothetical protein